MTPMKYKNVQKFNLNKNYIDLKLHIQFEYTLKCYCKLFFSYRIHIQLLQLVKMNFYFTFSRYIYKFKMP